MDFDKSASNPEQTLETFANGRIGELITEVIGNDELQSRFEADPTFQAEDYEGKPSGIIALDLGIVTPQMKEALLVAQAAARTVATVESKMERKFLNDEVFKFVGSERDGDALKQAQATWMGANTIDLNEANIIAFKQAASIQIKSAAKVIADNGFSDQARKLESLADYTKPEQTTALTPYEIIGKMAAQMTSENNARTDTETLKVFNLGISDFSFESINDAVAHETQLHRLAKLVKPNTDGHAPSGSAQRPWGGSGASKHWNNDGGPQ